jgi:hypothetical protein
VLSGDTIVLVAKSTAIPPPERTVSLSGVTAPRLQKRAKDGEAQEAKDEVIVIASLRQALTLSSLIVGYIDKF